MGENFLDEARDVSQRARRPHVLEGARARRHARRRHDRAARRARADSARHAALQPQRRRRCGAARGVDGSRVHAVVSSRRPPNRSRCSTTRSIASGLRYWKSAANFVLVDGGERARRAGRRPDRARRAGARPIEGSVLPELLSHHGGRGRAHTRRPSRRWRRCAQSGSRARDRARRTIRAGARTSTARAASTITPAFAFSITCSISSRGTAPSI